MQGLTLPGLPSTGPKLDIALAGLQQLRISWPTNAPEYALECATNLPATVWTTLLASPGGSSDTHPFIDALPFAGPEKSFRAWMDFSLLPEFEKVSKYFHFTVRAGSANAEGISFKFFSPTPTGARP